MKVTPTPTSGAADLPEALRSIQRFEVVDCIDDKHVPAVIPKPHGPWVRYEDHIAALAAGQATAAQAVVPPNAITASVMRDDGGEAPAFCLMAAYRSEKDAMDAFALIAAPQPIQARADGFFLLLPQRPKPEAPAGTVGLDWDAYSGAQMLAFGRDCSDAAIAALRTEQPAPATQQAGEAWQARASHGQAPAGAGMGHTDGGRNMFYEGRFDGESQREQQARLRWANDMRAAFERHTGNGWFDKDWRTETGLWSSAWHACLAAQPTTTAQSADSVQEDAARESEYRRGYRHGYEQRDAEVRGAMA